VVSESSVGLSFVTRDAAPSASRGGREGRRGRGGSRGSAAVELLALSRRTSLAGTLKLS
jgi:hypothetical protein